MSKARVWADTYASIKNEKPTPFAMENPPRGKVAAHVTDQGECWLSIEGSLFVLTPAAILGLARWTFDTFGDTKETL